MLVSVKRLSRLLALLAIPLVMIACDDDDEHRNPTCPSASGIEGESSSRNLADSMDQMPELYLRKGQNG